MTLLAFIVVIGVLVIVHEWGHFIAARRAGVRVETFSIGIGPEIWATERGGTRYRVAAIPLGGYVKMAGEEPQADGTAAPDGYAAQPLRKRVSIVLAGPLMNLVFAFIVAPFVYLVGVSEPVYWDEPSVVGWVDDAATAMVVQRGERITAVDGTPVRDWRGLYRLFVIAKGDVTLDLDGPAGPRRAVVHADRAGALTVSLLPPMASVVERVLPDSPAERAGLRAGDRVLEVGGVAIGHWMEIRREIDAVSGGDVTVAVARGADTVRVILRPAFDEPTQRWQIGIARQDPQTVRRYGVGQSLWLGTLRVVEMIGLTYRVLGGLFTGRLGLDALGGPISIAQGAGEAAKAGVGALLTFMVFISVQLGVLNLLPIPVLDGGHLLIMAIEKIAGRRLPDRWLEVAQWMGLAALVLLMLYVTRNDILRVWGTRLRELFGGG